MLGRSRFRMLVYATMRCAHCLRGVVSRQYRHPANAKQELIWCALEVNAGFTDEVRHAHTINRSANPLRTANPLPIELAEMTTLSA